MEERLCAHCATAFIPNKGGRVQRFCTRKCGARYWRKENLGREKEIHKESYIRTRIRRGLWTAANQTECMCAFCTAPFVPRIPWMKYCSPTCQKRAWWNGPVDRKKYAEHRLARIDENVEAHRAVRKAWYDANKDKINTKKRAWRAGQPRKLRAAPKIISSAERLARKREKARLLNIRNRALIEAAKYFLDLAQESNSESA